MTATTRITVTTVGDSDYTHHSHYIDDSDYTHHSDYIDDSDYTHHSDYSG